MAALFTEPRKCSGITEDSTSLRDEEKNIQVAIQLAEKLVKGLHKCKAERLKKKKKLLSVVKILPKVIDKVFTSPL